MTVEILVTNNTARKVADIANPILKAGRKTLLTEAKALEEAAKLLDDEFVEAVELIENIEGRVIVTGMGKSGHIARKMAATFASTGTPGEASHGDLGMIVRGDVVIALSNSGGSKELADLIAYTRRFAIPLIGITKNRDSDLGSQSDIVLQIPAFPEACPLDMAPTTSTTLSMAIGDALAVALLERRGFSKSDFSVFHPGGKLGQQMLKIEKIMHTGDELPLLHESAGVEQALSAITEKGFGCVGIVNDEGCLIGMISDGDVRRHAGDGFLAKNVKDVMTANPKTIGPDTLAGKAIGLMNNVDGTFRQITVLFVTDDSNKPVGLLHLHDCLRAGLA